MWKIGKVKENGKKAFKANYWKCVAMGLVAAAVFGTASFSAGLLGGRADGDAANERNAQMIELPDQYTDTDNNVDAKHVTVVEGEGDSLIVTVDEDGYISFADDPYAEGTTVEFTESDAEFLTAAGIIALVFLMIASLLVSAIAIVYDVFLVNPLRQGVHKFFLKNQDEEAEVSNIGFAFDHGYKNIVKNIFFRDLYVFLWSLLFIIPGIVKAYEYRMIPYLLCDNPDMTKEEVFAKSKAMMNGNKFKAFLLDLSFIGWDILSLFTFGLLSIFYVEPYKYSARAALYKELAGTSAS